VDKNWEQVRAFHLAFDNPYSDTPKFLDSKRANLRYCWMLEELDEFIASDEIVEQADAMIDLIYFALGTLVEMGIKPDKLFDIVHSANMSKLWEDGKPHFNEQGKVIKPKGWNDPHDKIKNAIDEM
jgi:predicted HAD superfamily Cof-like phosphohydrolase